MIMDRPRTVSWKNYSHATCVVNLGYRPRHKGGDLTQSYDKTPTPTEMSKGQSDYTNNATKKSSIKQQV